MIRAEVSVWWERERDEESMEIEVLNLLKLDT